MNLFYSKPMGNMISKIAIPYTKITEESPNNLKRTNILEKKMRHLPGLDKFNICVH